MIIPCPLSKREALRAGNGQTTHIPMALSTAVSCSRCKSTRSVVPFTRIEISKFRKMQLFGHVASDVYGCGPIRPRWAASNPPSTNVPSPSTSFNLVKNPCKKRTKFQTTSLVSQLHQSPCRVGTRIATMDGPNPNSIHSRNYTQLFFYYYHKRAAKVRMLMVGCL